MLGLRSMAKWYLSPAGPDRSHIDRDAAIRHRLCFEQPGNGFDAHLWVVGLAFHQLGDTARRIPARLRLAPVGIPDAHHDLGCRMAGRLEHNHLIAADADMTVSQSASGGSIDFDVCVAAVDYDKVIAEAMHLQEPDLAHWRPVI